MLSNKSVVRLTIACGIICWLSLLFTDLIILFGNINGIDPAIPEYIPKLLLNAFFLVLFTFYKFTMGKSDKVDFIDLIWQVFIVGLFTSFTSICIWLFFNMLSNNKFASNPLLQEFFYHVNIGLVATFLLSTFMVWKRLILYQKSKNLNRLWMVFEYAILASIFLNLFDFMSFSSRFNIALFTLVGLGLILSVNLKWIAYLNVKKKWISILLLLLIIVFLAYFLVTLVNYSVSIPLLQDMLTNIFLLALFAFTLMYAIFSLLVILFNLPTSSVFEKKLEEVINFQRLSQSSQSGQREEQVYDILLESSFSAVVADAAWLEIQDKFGNVQTLLTKNIKEDEVKELKENSAKERLKLKQVFKNMLEKKQITSQLTSSRNGSIYRSSLIFPLVVQNEQIGSLVLLKEVEDGFNKEMTDIINSFGSQACITIENFRLISEALDNERYKEELKIAKRVQHSLLPKKSLLNKAFDLSAFSEAADEVGGDYYDIYEISESKVAVIIGDVSGKGTSAAFNMSQMKGVFHSLVQLDLSASDFLVYANNALSSCLEKTSFITISYFILDSEKRTVEFARAGHCPTLYYDAKAQEAKFYQNKGLGLGILRNSSYYKYVEVNKIAFSPGDIIMLYTDGITEAKNNKQEEFGYERLKNILLKHRDKAPEDIKVVLLESLYEFCGDQVLNDDYSAVIIKFK